MSDLPHSLAQSWRLIPYWDGPGHIQMAMDDFHRDYFTVT
jgi:hypothetical protein